MASIHDGGDRASSRELQRERAAVPAAADFGVPWQALALQAAGLGAFSCNAATDAFTASPELGSVCGWEAASRPQRLPEFLARVHPEERARFREELSAATHHGASLDTQLRMRTDAGTVRWVRVRASSCSDGGRFTLAGVCEDVSAHRLAAAEDGAVLRRERELRLAAERTNRSKDEFLSVFSHELRSPLNAIIGWNRILAVKRAGDAEVLAMTARIERGAKAQLKMVNDLLDLGRINTGKLRIEPRPVRLLAVVAAAIEAARPAAAAKGVVLGSRLDGAAVQVSGDPDRLQQVIANLLSNAIKFTDKGGRIEVSLRTSGGSVALEVADSGRGIAAELLPYVFDRFRQGDNSLTRRDSGLGLGLTLVREITALHGGRVEVASAGSGCGSRFTVTLPVLSEAIAGSTVHHPPEMRVLARRALTGLSILVVDDEADGRAVVAETLRLEGARVLVGDSVASALERLNTGGERFDVLVTDIGMPLEDGYSLVRKLRRTPGGRHVLAIALTGYASQADREAAMEAGFDAHVAKPVDFDEFVPLIARLARITRSVVAEH
jgi:signal transduction histidine kinase/CheY-like chemotaxis protein